TSRRCVPDFWRACVLRALKRAGRLRSIEGFASPEGPSNPSLIALPLKIFVSGFGYLEAVVDMLGVSVTDDLTGRVLLRDTAAYDLSDSGAGAILQSLCLSI